MAACTPPVYTRCLEVRLSHTNTGFKGLRGSFGMADSEVGSLILGNQSVLINKSLLLSHYLDRAWVANF